MNEKQQQNHNIKNSDKLWKNQTMSGANDMQDDLKSEVIFVSKTVLTIHPLENITLTSIMST